MKRKDIKSVKAAERERALTKHLDMSEHQRRLARLESPARLSGIMNTVLVVILLAALAIVIWEMSGYF